MHAYQIMQPPVDAADVYASVHRLAESLMTAGRRSHAELLQRALAAAAAAQRRLALQDERIQRLQHLATTDALTGVLNRRGFDAALEHALARARRYGERGVLISIDLDDFKSINDGYGHAAGDEALRQVASIITELVRDTDHVGRIGGDEFAVLLVETNWEDGHHRAGLLERQINQAMVRWHGHAIALRASFGVQPYDDLCHDNLMHRVDHAMYQAKRVRLQSSAYKAAIA